MVHHMQEGAAHATVSLCHMAALHEQRALLALPIDACSDGESHGAGTCNKQEAALHGASHEVIT